MHAMLLSNACQQPDYLCMLQRAVLERLTGLMMTPVGDAVPAGIVALEAMRLIVELLGEVSGEEVQQMKQPCLTKLTSCTRPLRAQASACSSWLCTGPNHQPCCPQERVCHLMPCMPRVLRLDEVISLTT